MKGIVRRNRSPEKANFLTLEEKEARRCREKHKDWVVNHQDESIGECYHSIKRQAHRYNSEIRSLRFFQPGNHIDLACQVLAIADWVEEFNELSHNPIPEIPGSFALLHTVVPRRPRDNSHCHHPRKNPGSLMCRPGHKLYGFTCVPSCSTLRMTWPPGKVPCMVGRTVNLVL